MPSFREYIRDGGFGRIWGAGVVATIAAATSREADRKT